MSSFAEVQLEILRLHEKSGKINPTLNAPAAIRQQVAEVVGESGVQLLLLCAQFDIDFVQCMYAAYDRRKGE